MDPFSAEGELINLHNHFHQGQYAEAAAYDTSTLSPSNALPAKVLKLRAQLALGQHAKVAAATKGAQEVELQALNALAEYRSAAASDKKSGGGGGGQDGAVKKLETLVVADEAVKNATALVAAGTVLLDQGRPEEALAVLGRHEGSLDCVALVVQAYLVMNRNDLALKEVVAAKRWAQDSLLVNLAEAWVGMRLGGEKYQQSFYVFEELAQTTATSSARSLVGQAVAELHLGRLDEAQAALDQARQKDPGCADAVANALVLAVVAGKDDDQKALAAELKGLAPGHHLLADLAEKESLFEKAAGKYSAAKAS